MASTSISTACPALGGTKTVAANKPLRTQDLPVLGAFFGGGIFRGSLDVENRAAVGQQRSKLTALDAADFKMVGSHAKDGSRGRAPQFQNVIGVAIQNSPSDSCRGSRACDLRQSGAADRFEHNGVWALIFVGLDNFENLRALRNGVVIRVNDLDFQ